MRTRLRSPHGIFAFQAAMYATYHMTNPAVFYNKEDLLEIQTLDAEPSAQVMEPLLHHHEAAGRAGAGVHQDAALHPARKDNLASWMVARSDGEHYGHMRVFRFPKQKVVFGPRQIVARINQDQAIAPQITLWNQQGSEVLPGTLLVIPIEESLLYVRPLYLRSVGGRIPELKRVVVAHQNQIVMEATLEEVLERLFPSGTERAKPPANLAGKVGHRERPGTWPSLSEGNNGAHLRPYLWLEPWRLRAMPCQRLFGVHLWRGEESSAARPKDSCRPD